MKKLAFILNGKIKRQENIISRLKRIFKGDYELEFLITTAQSGATLLTVTAVKNGFYCIICIGGDGTLNEVVNGIMEAKKATSAEDAARLRVGVLPYGSGNDFVKTIHISFDLAYLKKLIDDDRYREIDLGLVKFKNHSGDDSLRYFINITDVGLGGIVVKRVNQSAKWLGAFLAYQWVILTSFIFYRHQSVKASADSMIYTGKVMNYIVANGKYFGSGLGIAPYAVPDDGFFSIVIVGEVSLGFYLKSLSAIKNSKRIIHPQVFYEQAKEIVVESQVPQPIDMDGEFIGNTPMKIKMVPKALKFLC